MKKSHKTFASFYIHGTAAQEHMLICRSLSTRTLIEIFFNFIDPYFKKQDKSWRLLHKICTDGANGMLGKLNDVVARMKQIIILHKTLLLHIAVRWVFHGRVSEIFWIKRWNINFLIWTCTSISIISKHKVKLMLLFYN